MTPSAPLSSSNLLTRYVPFNLSEPAEWSDYASCDTKSRTASSTSFVRAALKNSTFSAVIAEDVPFDSAHPDRISTSLTVPPEFVKGFYGT